MAEEPEEVLEPSEEAPKKAKRTKKAKVTQDMDTSVTEDMLKPAKKAKAPKEKEPPKAPMTVREALMDRLKDFNIEDHKRPWMATKTFRLVTDIEDLKRWVKRTIDNVHAYRLNPIGELVPVVAVDTETTGLDTRIVCGKINSDAAGVCLSSDGIEGLYVPITHDVFLDRLEVAEVLQPLFDRSHLVFFNAKFDREILRTTLGMTFRPWPYFEDVQIFNFLLDPKADVSEKKGSMGQNGLKALSEKYLRMEQIELGDLCKVKVRKLNASGKYSYRQVYAPFNLLPVEQAVWYAAADGIVTWLLWEMWHERARKQPLPMQIDHELVDSLTWIERQRYYVDNAHLGKTMKWHKAKMATLQAELSAMSGVENFNPASATQMSKVLFEDMGFKPYKVSDKTGQASTDGETLEELAKQRPDDPFLKKLFEFREYASLHPDKLNFDPRDQSARIHLKQCTVAGGRLSANGGEFDVDGGCGLNIQAIKAVAGNKWAKARLLNEEVEDIDMDALPEYDLSLVDPAFVGDVEEEVPNPAYLVPLEDFSEAEIEATEKLNEGTPKTIKVKTRKVTCKLSYKNHLVSLLGYTYCVVPSCKYCKEKLTVLKEKAKADLNEILNLRSLFKSKPGWTFSTIDYSNIEMRCAANVSKEPKFIDEFLLGSGDFHTLTAIVVFGDKFTKETDKVKKKALRGIAKILNFALLYGGTEHTIYEKLKLNDPNATLGLAKEMVTAYWEGVPGFKKWVDHQCDIAQNDLYTETATGRVIGFKTAMETMKIREPRADEEDFFREYQKCRKKAREFEAMADEMRDQGAEVYEIHDARKRAKRYNDQAIALWKDDSTGVRNYCDFNKFISKAGRLSMNIPLQGLAGDLMRMALNEICKWARAEGVEGAMRMHGTVHDEIDPSIKNEYYPYIMPRLSRLMKHRKLHEERGWTVPIETDAEYGTSWDIEHHLTGDSEHKPSGWYDMPGMETYVPMEWADEYEDVLSKRLDTPERRAKLAKALASAVHPKTQNCLDLLGKAETPEEADKWLVICLQLDEYWRVDGGEDPYTLQEFEDYYGLTMPELPVGGFLDPMPKDLLRLHEEERLRNKDAFEAALLATEEEKEHEALVARAAESGILIPEPQEVEIQSDKGLPVPPMAVEVVTEACWMTEEPLGFKCETDPEPEPLFVPSLQMDPQGNVQMGSCLNMAAVEAPPEPQTEIGPEGDTVDIRVKYSPTLQCLRFMDEEDLDGFLKLLGRGKKSLTVIYCGEIYEIPGVATEEVPEGYGYPIDTLERLDDGKPIGVEQFSFTD